MGRRSPRPASEAIGRVRAEVAPPGGLPAIQLAWRELVGEPVAAACWPVSERDGVLKVHCVDAVWAEELAMMKQSLLQRLSERFGPAAPSDVRFLVGDVTE